MNPINYDKQLWFEIDHCSGDHYLIGNPHTFRGRMMAWCTSQQKSFYVSKAELGKRSKETEYWIRGFLAGNEAEPPSDIEGQTDFNSPEYQLWCEAVSLFHRTGYWNENDRYCDSCGAMVLHSEPASICSECRAKSAP